MAQDKFTWTDNPTVSGVSKCDTDVLNECLMHLKYDNKGSGGFNLFDTKISDHILTGDEAAGWALQGSLVTMTYPDAVNKIKTEYSTGTEESVYDLVPITLPVFTSNTTDGITVSDTHRGDNAYGLINGVSGATIGLWANYSFTIDFAKTTKINSYTIQADSVGNPEYPTDWDLMGSNDGEHWTVLDSKSSMVFSLGQIQTFKVNVNEFYSQYCLNFKAGKLSNNSGELNKLSFDVSEKVTRFYYKVAENGHRIADIAEKPAIDEWYRNTGIADYYILDSTNNRFYLPRTNWFMKPSVDASLLNRYNEPGLPNIEGSWFPHRGYTPKGCVKQGTETMGDSAGASFAITMSQFEIDASLSNSIYGNSDTVQPPSSNKLLYYRVGNTVVNESLIDVGQVLSDVQLKMDADHANDTKPFVTEIYKNGSSWYRVWSDGFIEQAGEHQGFGYGANGTVTLLKDFKTTDYFVNATQWKSGGYGLTNYVRSKTISNFTVQADAGNTAGATSPFYWYACGY